MPRIEQDEFSRPYRGVKSVASSRSRASSHRRLLLLLYQRLVHSLWLRFVSVVRQKYRYMWGPTMWIKGVLFVTKNGLTRTLLLRDRGAGGNIPVPESVGIPTNVPFHFFRKERFQETQIGQVCAATELYGRSIL